MDQKELGRSSGFYHAGAELPDFVRLVLTDPEEAATGIVALNREYAAISGDPTRDETELWIDIAQSASNDAHRRQNRDTPHPVPDGSQTADIEHCVEEFADNGQVTSSYCQYASGWYEGYAAYLIAEAAIGTKGISQSSNMGTLVDDVGTNLDSASGLRKIDAPGTRTGKITHRIVADGGNPDIDAPTVQRHLRDDHGIETAGGFDHAITQLKGVRHTDELSSSEQAALAARLSRSSDSSAARTFIDELDNVEDARFLLDQDQATVNQLVRWHATPETIRNIDPDLEASNLVHVARNSEDVSDIQLIVKSSDADENVVVRWLEEGDLNEGWTHIEARHIEGTHKLDGEDATSVFPTGEEIKGQELPNTVSRNEVRDMIYGAIKDGEPTPQGQKTKYYFEPTENGYPASGIDDMNVIVFSDGTVETAIPISGDSVKRWVSDLGKFIDTK